MNVINNFISWECLVFQKNNSFKNKRSQRVKILIFSQIFAFS